MLGDSDGLVGLNVESLVSWAIVAPVRITGKQVIMVGGGWKGVLARLMGCRLQLRENHG